MAGFTTLFVFAGFFGALLLLLKWLLTKALRNEEEQEVRYATDPFLKDNGFTWDFIFVFKVFGEDERLNAYQRDNTLKKTIRKLNKGGVQVRMFFSVQQDEVYIKVRASTSRLKLEAARTGYKMLLDEKNAEARARKGGYDEQRRQLWKPLELSSAKRFSTLGAYKFIYASFVNDPNLESLYKIHRSTGSCFRSIDRIKLLVSIMESSTADGGCGLDIENMVAQKAALAAFPLHTWPERRDLMRRVLVLCMLPWNTPLDMIKDYFGEKVGLYYLLLSHYTTWLLSAAIVGIGIYVHVALQDGDPNVWSVPIFCAFIAIWTTCFLEFWKRKEVTYAMRWGTSGFEDSQADRPEFEGHLVTSPIDGSKVKWADEGEKFRAHLCSQVTISVAILCVVGAVTSIFVFKIFATHRPRYFTLNGRDMGPIIVSLANSIQIQVMSAVYGQIATRLNDAENHRTQSEFEDALISKTFVFQFVNSFASLFYIAFIKRHVEGQCLVSCLDELSTALSTIFLTRLVSSNVNAILVASFNSESRMQTEMAGVSPGCVLTPAEREFSMEPYDTVMSTFTQYADLAVQFGYATLFAGAFPLSPVMALLDNYIKSRVNVWRLCMITRRPSPASAEDIGTWLTIFEIMSTACVLTNCGLVFFTSTIFSTLTLFQRMACFAAFEHVLLALKSGLEKGMPDVPEQVQLQLDRQEFITSKIIDQTPDKPEESEASNLMVNMAILPTDDDYYYEASDPLPPPGHKRKQTAMSNASSKGYAELVEVVQAPAS